MTPGREGRGKRCLGLLLVLAALGLSLLGRWGRSDSGILPENGALQELSWNHSGMTADQCFCVTFCRTAEGGFLTGTFPAGDGSLRELDGSLTREQWAALEALLREMAGKAYVLPEEILDGSDGFLTVTWTMGGRTVRERYAAEQEKTLYAFLGALLAEVRDAGE